MPSPFTFSVVVKLIRRNIHVLNNSAMLMTSARTSSGTRRHKQLFGKTWGPGPGAQ